MTCNIWVDDAREAPYSNKIDWITLKTVNDFKKIVPSLESVGVTINIISLDHDAGEYYSDGGDYIKILDWLEETGRNYPIHIHSMNAVGCQNMRQIIEKNNWKYVQDLN